MKKGSIMGTAGTRRMEKGQNVSQLRKSSEANKINRTRLQQNSLSQENQNNTEKNFLNVYLFFFFLFFFLRSALMKQILKHHIYVLHCDKTLEK